MAPTTSRELQYSSASAGVYVTGQLVASRDDPWQLMDESNPTTTTTALADPTEIAIQPCTVLQAGVSLRVAPMARQTGGWSEIHFHPKLRLPIQQFGTQNPQGVTILLEAMGRECVAVALSPEASFCLGTTYVVHFGASGNVSTVIRRRLSPDQQAFMNQQQQSYLTNNNKESVEASFPSRVCSEQSWISYWICWIPSSSGSGGQLWVGVGKVPGQRCIGYLQDDNTHSDSQQSTLRYVGLGNSGLGRQADAMKYRNVVVTSLPTFLPDVLEQLMHQDLPMTTVDFDENDNAETKALMEEYQKECRKSKARAQKFGIPYKEPPPEAFSLWSKARRLRANPRKGFLTGLDLMSPEEVAKQEARKRRFGIGSSDNDQDLDNNDNDGSLDDNDNTTNNNESMEDGKRSATGDSQAAHHAVLEAWDNEAFVCAHRVDPPPQLWNQQPHDTIIESNDEQTEGAAATVPEKIHIFSIDWAAFKQIRTDDIMAYFSVYGPSYVEWMGELSCNVLFEDKYSAARALQHLSTELPTPPPEELTNEQPEDSDESYQPSDLRNMGWRLCKHPIRKLANDRYGRRGTRARILMRLGTNLDVLVERPTSQPPPPGFSTHRILGPGSEFENGPKRKRHRPDGNESREGTETTETVADGSEEPTLLNRELRARRSGYTVEQMEAERQAKRQEQQRDEEAESHQSMPETEDQDIDLSIEY